MSLFHQKRRKKIGPGPVGASDGPTGLLVSSISENSAILSWGNLAGATSYQIEGKEQSNGSYSVIGNTYVPNSETNFNFAGFDALDGSNGLNTSNNDVRTTYSLASGQMDNDPDGVILTLDIDTNYPIDHTGRSELREQPNTFIPIEGQTIVYEVNFEKLQFPTTLYQVITIMQLFDHGTFANPRWKYHITGENQFSGDQGKIQIEEEYTDSRIIQPYFLLDNNYIRVVHYFHSSQGHIEWYFNGNLIHSVSDVDTLFEVGAAQAVQFGCYPHGYKSDSASRAEQVTSGETTIQFNINNYRKRVFSGDLSEADLSGEINPTTILYDSLNSNTTHNWRVKAVVADSDTNYSNGPNFSTLAGAGGGDGPTGLSVDSISDSSATFSWSSLSGATSYTVEAKPQSSSTYSALGSTASTNFTSNALTAGTAYDWRVRAVVSGQNTNYSTGPQFSTTGAASANIPYLMLPHPFYSELEVDHTRTEIKLEFKDPIKFGPSPSIVLKNLGGSTIKTFGSGERSIEGHWNHALKLTGVSFNQDETYSLVISSGSIQDSASSTNWPGLSQNEYVFTTTKSSYNEIYVSPSGSDSNNGLSSGSPKLTLQGAWAIAGADSRINLAAGIYRQIDVTLSSKVNHRNPIIIKGAGKSQTFIRGSQVLSGWTNVGGNKWKTGLSASGFNSQQCWHNGVHLTQWGANVSRYNSGSESYLDDQGTDENDMIQGSFYHKASSNEIFVWLSDDSNPNNSLMEASRATWVLETRDVEGLVMKDLTIEHDGNDNRVTCGIIKPGPRQKFTNMNIRYGSFQNFRITSGRPYLQIEYCDISYGGDVGLDANNGSVTTETQRNYFSFNNNTVHHNNYRNFWYAWHSGGFKMIPGMFHVCVWDNIYYENHGPNIWFDHPMGENLVQGNTITGHTDSSKLGQGIFYEVSENLVGNWGVIIRNNLVVDTWRQGVYISASEEAEVYNNTIVGSWAPMVLHGMPRQDTTKTPTIVYQLNDNTVYNNILENKTGIGGPGTFTVIYTGNDNNGNPVSGNSVNRNFYNTGYSGSGSDAYLAITSANDYGGTDTGVGPGSSACGKGYECDGIKGDAQFIDRVDFQLQAGSPAAGKGYLG